MSARGKTQGPRIPAEELSSRPKPASVGRVFARVPERRLMTREERLAFIDSIRTKVVGPAEDTTPLIRRDRDER